MPFENSSTISAEECIAQPLAVIQKLLDVIPADQATQSSDWGIPAFFESKLSGVSVPSLNSFYTKDGSQFIANPGPAHESLVRFRCIVQDTLNSEFYAGLVKCPKEIGTTKLRTGRYTEIFNLSEEEQKFVNFRDPEQMAQRLVVNCVTIPGESDWLRKEAGIESVSEREVKHEAATIATANSSLRSTRKRGMEDDDMEMGDQKVDTAKQARVAPTAQPSQPSEGNHTSSFVSASRMQCLVKVYSEDESVMKVGQTYEFLGVFCIPPELAEFEDDNDDSELAHWPASKVLRLHAISFRPVTNNDYLTPDPSDSANFPSAVNEIKSNLNTVRTSLLQYLQAVCGGDSAAAVLLLCHLVSRVHLKQHGKAVGKLSLNLSLPADSENTNFSDVLSSLYHMLLPRVQAFKVDVPSLTAKKLYPVKDYESNCLSPSALQMAPGTAMILDETEMSSGNLNDTGCRNVRALAKISMDQSLEYDFVYHTLDFDVDFPLLVVSKGTSIIPSDGRYDLAATVPLQLPTPPSPELVKQWRRYLAVARQGKLEISETAGNMITESFVALRKATPSTKESDLHLRMDIARCMCGSYLTDELPPRVWEEVLSLSNHLTSQPLATAATNLASTA